MALHLLLTYCGVYLAAKPLYRRQLQREIGGLAFATQILMLVVFANLCFGGVWFFKASGLLGATALLTFELSLALPLGCAWAKAYPK